MDEDSGLQMGVKPEQWRVLRAMEYVSWAGAQLAGSHGMFDPEQSKRNLSSNEQRTRDAALFCLHEYFQRDMSGPHVIVLSDSEFNRIRGQLEPEAEPEEATAKLRALVEKARQRGDK